jgi:hypothetical protein
MHTRKAVRQLELKAALPNCAAAARGEKVRRWNLWKLLLVARRSSFVLDAHQRNYRSVGEARLIRRKMGGKKRGEAEKRWHTNVRPHLLDNDESYTKPHVSRRLRKITYLTVFGSRKSSRLKKSTRT